MNEQILKDYETLLEHWNTVFRLTREEKDRSEWTAREDGWKDLTPSEKLIEAAASLKDCKNVLDYGSGCGWAGIAMAKYGCQNITCADPALNAKEMAEFYARRFGVAENVHPVHITDSWLSEVPEGSYDGFFCSNVLDVIPPEMAEEILQNASRIVRNNSPVIISLNYYMPDEFVKERGLDCRNGNMIYIDGILRLVNRSDEEWRELLSRYFTVEKLDYFAWPGETSETRRLFYLRKKDTTVTLEKVTAEDYDAVFELWNSMAETRRALNTVDDSREGIERYLKRNPDTCFKALDENGRIMGVILSGNDGRRGIIHHLCVHPDHRREGVAGMLVKRAEEALQEEGISKIFCLVFVDNDAANEFWEKQRYTVRTNINYRNKSLNEKVPQGD